MDGFYTTKWSTLEGGSKENAHSAIKRNVYKRGGKRISKLMRRCGIFLRLLQAEVGNGYHRTPKTKEDSKSNREKT